MNENRLLKLEIGFYVSTLVIVLLYYLNHFGRHYTGFEEIYFLVLLVTSMLVLISSNYKSIKWNNQNCRLSQNQNDWFWPLAILFISITTKLYFSPWIPTWGDEISQHMKGVQLGPFMGAAWQQQPPLGYYFSTLSFHYFDLNIMSMRWHNSVIHTLFLIAFYLYLKTLGFNLGAILFSCLFIFLDPAVFKYGIESRTISLALLCALFFYFQTERAQDDRFASTAMFRIAASTFLMLSTIGFQAPIFAFAVFCLSFWRLVYYRKSISVVTGIFAGIVFYIPIQMVTIQKSTSYLNSINWENIFNAPSAAPQNLMLLAAVIIALGAILRWRNVYRSRKMTYHLSIYLIFMASGLLLFNLFINYNLYSRYLVLGIIPLSVGILYFTEAIGTWILTRAVLLRSIKYSVITGIIFSTIYFSTTYPTLAKHQFSWRLELHNVVRYLKENMKDQDLVLPLCNIDTTSCWDYVYLVSYYKLNSDSKLSAPIKRIMSVSEPVASNTALYFYLKTPVFTCIKNENEKYLVLTHQKNGLFKFVGPSQIQDLRRMLESDCWQRLDFVNCKWCNYSLEISKKLVDHLIELKPIQPLDNCDKLSFWEAREFCISAAKQ